MSTLEPIVHSFSLSCDAGHAFATYVDRIGEWWLPEYTAGSDTFETVVIQPADDGRVFERHADGKEIDWGRVTLWEPGVRLAYTSTLAQAGEHASLVTVTFAGPGPGCEMLFEHGGWNDDNASYRSKFGDWPILLGRFVDLAQAT
jgi:hypothetical protein